jgi:hypothetical protein
MAVVQPAESLSTAGWYAWASGSFAGRSSNSSCASVRDGVSAFLQSASRIAKLFGGAPTVNTRVAPTGPGCS